MNLRQEHKDLKEYLEKKFPKGKDNRSRVFATVGGEINNQGELTLRVSCIISNSKTLANDFVFHENDTDYDALMEKLEFAIKMHYKERKQQNVEL